MSSNLTRPGRFLLRMALFMAAAIAAGAGSLRAAFSAFIANPAFNGGIVGVFFVGAIVWVGQAFSLENGVGWV